MDETHDPKRKSWVQSAEGHRDFPIQNVHFLSAWVAGPTYEAAFGYGQMAAHSVPLD